MESIWHEDLDHFHFIGNTGFLDVSELQAVGRDIWGVTGQKCNSLNTFDLKNCYNGRLIEYLQPQGCIYFLPELGLSLDSPFFM